jgi:hypothetical protein
MGIYTGKYGELRIYDGTGTPNYMVVPFIPADLSAPMGRQRPEEILKLDRGNLTSDAAYVQGPDDPILEPLDISFSVRLDTLKNAVELYNFLTCGTLSDTTVLSSTKGSTQLTAGDGSSVYTPAFADSQKKTVNIEAKWTVGASSFARQWNEVYFMPSNIEIAEAADEVVVNATGQIYGDIAPINDFTSGVDKTPS